MPFCSKIIIRSLIVSVLISTSYGFNACCSYPCQNNGVCMPTGERVDQYECDCTGTGYFGKFCQRPTWGVWIRSFYKLSSRTKTKILTGYSLMWSIFNSNKYLHNKATTYIYRSRSTTVPTPHMFNSNQEYTTLDVYYNRSYYGRELPPVPCDCPTAMGVVGPVELPSEAEVYERILKRATFKPDRRGTNQLLAAYANHFTNQFFKTDYARGAGFTYGNEGVDASQVYGPDERTRWALRSKIDGKMKTRILNGEEFPPFLEDAPEVNMFYPQGKHEPNWRYSTALPQEEVSPKWAFGHAHFSRTPHLFVMATVWLREHNHACNVLRKRNPRWDDERLYQTARLIITGEMLTIGMSEYLQHITQYKLRLVYQPPLAHGVLGVQYSNRIRQEFNHMYHWHQMIPDEVHVGDASYNSSALLFTNNQAVFEHGFDAWVEAMTRQVAGELTHHNHGCSMAAITRHVLTEGRSIRLQPFNNYRRRFGLEPYATFEEMTGERQLAAVLREMYGDVDAVEFYVGLTVERTYRSVVSPTMLGMGGPWTIKSLMSNPVGSPGWWKPSTFGGLEGFNMVRYATLKKLFCNNMRGRCRGFKIGFLVPDYKHHSE